MAYLGHFWPKYAYFFLKKSKNIFRNIVEQICKNDAFYNMFTVEKFEIIFLFKMSKKAAKNAQKHLFLEM